MTYLELINDVLVRLREPTVSTNLETQDNDVLRTN